MKEKIEWLKEHKKEVLIGTGAFVGATVLVVLGVKHSKSSKKNLMNASNEIIEAFKRTEDAIDDHFCVDYEAIPIKDLGNIGEKFLENTPGTNKNTLVQVIAYIEKKDLDYVVT